MKHMFPALAVLLSVSRVLSMRTNDYSINNRRNS